MPRRIVFPSYERGPGTQVHQFPFQISMTAMRLLQGTTFYPVFVDTATALYRDSVSNMLDSVKSKCVTDGMDAVTWETSFDCMMEYMQCLPNPPSQNAVVAGVSVWDWYVGKLGKFIEFGRKHGQRPEMEKKLERNLSIIPLRDFDEQIHILETASDNKLHVADSDKESINEMILLRNLGIHCQWRLHRITCSTPIPWVGPLEISER